MKLRAAATKVITRRPGRTGALAKVEARLALTNLDLSESGFLLARALMQASGRRAHLPKHKRMYLRRLSWWATAKVHPGVGAAPV